MVLKLDTVIVIAIYQYNLSYPITFRIYYFPLTNPPFPSSKVAFSEITEILKTLFKVLKEYPVNLILLGIIFEEKASNI